MAVGPARPGAAMQSVLTFISLLRAFHPMHQHYFTICRNRRQSTTRQHLAFLRNHSCVVTIMHVRAAGLRAHCRPEGTLTPAGHHSPTPPAAGARRRCGGAGVVLVTNAAASGAIRDVYDETRTVLEAAGALSVAGARAYLKRNSIQARPAPPGAPAPLLAARPRADVCSNLRDEQLRCTSKTLVHERRLDEQYSLRTFFGVTVHACTDTEPRN